jgi:O-antigen/teichoic acid export membrane protein
MLSGPIIRLITESGYDESIAVLKILSIAIGIIFFGNLAGNALIALDLHKKGMWAYGIGAVVNVVANLLLIPKYSYYAASWVTIGTEAVVTLIMFGIIVRHERHMPKLTPLLTSGIATMLMVVCVYPFRNSLLFGTLAALSYGIALVLVGGVSVNELKSFFSYRARESM